MGDNRAPGSAWALAGPAALGELTDGYTHYGKYVGRGEDFALDGAYLKWYDIHREPEGMEAALREEARSFLRAELAAGRLVFSGQLGFLELHHCASVAFLLVFSWRNDNELWLANYVKALAPDSGGFRPVEEQAGASRPMLCVWELAPVWHERQAWDRYLRSPRAEADKRAYLADRFSGPC